jgi:hypothetical protein
MSPARRLILLGALVSAMACAQSQPADQVQVSDPGMKLEPTKDEKFAGLQLGNQALSLSNSLIRYGLSYHAYFDPAGGSAAKPTPEGYLGMPEPSGCNWYSGGFLYLNLNGKDLGTVRPAVVRAVEQGERGQVEIIWAPPEGQVRLRFLLEPKADYLACELALRPTQEIKSLNLSFRCYPSFFTTWFHRDGWRQVVGPTTVTEQDKPAQLDPVKDNWLLYQDTVFDVAKNPTDSAGPCALLYLPEQLTSVQVAPGSYAVGTEVAVKPDVRNLRFAVWEFPQKTNAQVLAELRQTAPQVTARLRQLDFTERDLATFDAAKERATLDALIAKSSDPERWRKSLAPILDKITAALRALQGGDFLAEQTASQAIAEYREAVWGPKFDALLSE